MKKMLLFLILFLFISTVSIASAGSLYNYPHLYQGLRSLGMGGTFTAIGKDPEALFYNPAGLYEMGFQLAVFNPLIEVDQNAIDLASKFQDALNKDTDTDRIDALTDIISDNMGKPLHLRFSLFPHVAVKNVAVGAIAQGLLDTRLHNPLSSEGAVEVSGGYEYGPVAGFSVGLPVTGLRAGAGIKFISNTWIEEGFTVRDIASEGFDPMDSKVENSDLSFDIGFLYDLPVVESIKPKLGVSFLNITDLDFRENDKGRFIPMTTNIGLSINPGLLSFVETVFAVDYQDITGGYEQDESFWKRIHMGAELGLLGRHIVFRGGLNQGYPSIGAELDVWVLKFGYVYYSEEMGPYAGQDKDSRHLAQLSLGW